ncbi:hypothetical protein PYW08_012813 [Mythimna loreyi]|uniref:Uncharacterized protein n=1 Tax=Mythimna loreyi TaxID=667449 RepID=A0ACC2Q174_9NEOP|nr:hypothetical protein PYW08_012813 [Mythimna loreyi]
MRLICFWCFLLAAAVRGQINGYYAPQTFRQVEPALFEPLDRPWNQKIPTDPYQRTLFAPASDVSAQSTTVVDPWRPVPVNEQWKGNQDRNSGSSGQYIPKAEPWRLPYGGLTKEQQASILHHKQSLTSDGAFRFEYASDNGLAAGEQIEPDGSRVGAYQYKDPSGQLVKLKYRAGKDGFQILEGSHLPKSPEPVAPSSGDNYYQQAYAQQREQYNLQQQYNQQKPEPQQQTWGQNQGPVEQRPAGNQYFVSNWRPQGEDDGQYRENEVENQNNKPHSFGEGFAFAFQG